MTDAPRILHLHSSFDAGGKELRCVRLINAFADAEHAVVSGDPERRSAAALIGRKARVSWPAFPSLTGKPLPGTAPVAMQQGRYLGRTILADLKGLPRERWHLTRARDVMRPIAPRFFVEPNATLAYAQELMKRNGIGSVAVVGRTGELVGFLQSGKIKRTKRK